MGYTREGENSKENTWTLVRGVIFTLSSKTRLLVWRRESEVSQSATFPKAGFINLSVGKKILNGAIPTDASLHHKIAESWVYPA